MTPPSVPASARAEIAARAPRYLNDPVCCRHSGFTKTCRPAISSRNGRGQEGRASHMAGAAQRGGVDHVDIHGSFRHPAMKRGKRFGFIEKGHMAPVGDFGRDHVGPPLFHPGQCRGAQKVGIRAPDRGERQARGRVEERPEIGQRLGSRLFHGVAQARVIVDDETLGGFDVMLVHLFLPAALRHVPETGEQRAAHAGGFGIGFLDRVPTDVAEDRGKALGREFRSDIVEENPGQAVLRGGRQQHGDQPAARGSEDRGLRKAQMIEQRQRVLGLGRDRVGGGVGPVGSAAPAIVEPDQPDPGEMWGHIVEIAGVPGQAGKAEDRRAEAFVGVAQAGAVWARENPASGRRGDGRDRCEIGEDRGGAARKAILGVTGAVDPDGVKTECSCPRHVPAVGRDEQHLARGGAEPRIPPSHKHARPV